ncbi:MAG: peptide chain release factor N(5)-glutamine methyltransferase [Schwartzia sp. (in: firmicutes)]
MTREELWTIGRLLQWSEGFFRDKGIETPRLDAEVLLSHVLEQPRIYLYVHYDQPLDPEELAAYRGFVRRRAAREPVAYLLGEREFMGITFAVSPAVLVPQPDTETLVNEVQKRLVGKRGARIADIGTGSGAIALSLLHALADLTAAAVDISSAALDVARENAARLSLSDRVTFYEGNLLAPLLGQTFDAIVSNPPYIPRGEIAALPPEVQAEPRLALDGGADGLTFYRRLVDEAEAFLSPGGFLSVEAGQGEAAAIVSMAHEKGWIGVETAEDLAGIDRVVTMYRA